MKHAPLLVLLALLLPAAGQPADRAANQPAGQKDPWEPWKHRRAVEIEAASEVRLVSALLPREVYAAARRDLGDLRVADDAGREVPYMLHARRGRRQHTARDVRLLETSFLPGQYTQVLAEMGAAREPHNSLELLTAETDFFAWVEVAAGDDLLEWRILRERLPVYRFAAEGQGNQTLAYGESTARYLRLRIFKPDARLAVRGARTSHVVVEEPERVTYPADVRAEADPPEKQSVFRADFGEAQPPVSEVRFTVAEAEFHRPVRISASDDGQHWRSVGSGEIYRIRRGTQTHEHTTVAFPETAARYLRVAVFNRDDPPLAPTLSGLELLGTPRRVVFRAEPGRSYRLLYGNPKAFAPEYELARLLSPAELLAAAPATVATEPKRPPAPPRAVEIPWTERHPVLLWSALGIAVLVLGLLAIRALRGA